MSVRHADAICQRTSRLASRCTVDMDVLHAWPYGCKVRTDMTGVHQQNRSVMGKPARKFYSTLTSHDEHLSHKKAIQEVVLCSAGCIM